MKSKITFFTLLSMVALLGFAQAPTYAFLKNIAFNPNGEINANRMTIARDGSIYIAGTSDLDDAIFANGDTITDDGLPFRRDGWLAKFDANGNVLWTKEFDQGDQYGIGSINLDQNENIYVTGRSEDTTNIDGVIVPDDSFYWMKLDSNGNRLNHVFFKSTSAMQNSYVGGAVDSVGNTYMAGLFNGTITIGSSNYSASNGSCFLLKLNNTGQVQWSQQVTSGFPSVLEIAKNGNLIYGGICNRGASFGNFTCASTNTASRSNPIISELNEANGNPIWIVNPQCDRGGSITGIHQMNDGSYIFGGTYGDDNQFKTSCELDFGSNIVLDPAPSPFSPFLGSRSNYIAKINSSGNVQWAKKVGQRADPESNVEHIVGYGDSVYVVGTTRDTNYLYKGTDSIAIRTFNRAVMISTVDANGDFQKVRPSLLFQDDIAPGFFDVQVSKDGSLYAVGSFDENYRYSLTDSLVVTGREDLYLAKINSLEPFSVPAPTNLRTVAKGTTQSSFPTYKADLAWTGINTVFGYVLDYTDGYNTPKNYTTFSNTDTSHSITVGYATGLTYTAVVKSHFMDMVSLNSNQIVDTSSAITTSIAALENKKAFISMYPNPTTERLFVESSENIERIIVRNITGKVLKDQVENSTKLSTINLSDLSSGFYFVEIVGSGFRQIQKINKL